MEKKMPLINIKDDDFKKTVLDQDGLVLVDFWAEWCGPCKQIGPLLEEMANNEELSLRVAKINIDENPIVATDYGIRSIPTMLLFSNGELKDTKIGALPKSELEDWIRDNS
ncbi:MAG: thioredoxin [Rhodobiaceae bacterium]|jgi:thioredoxin 1|nr:thioredoxin [Rhodobiaceae bacterium]|tara:strand:+ start:11549 stop:11881 length:333 start_codon:yes stop_codon:yes gene_type:complete